MRKKIWVGLTCVLFAAALMTPMAAADSDTFSFGIEALLDYTGSEAATNDSETFSFGIEALLDYTGSEAATNDSDTFSFGIEAPLDYISDNSAPSVSDPQPANGSTDVANDTAISVTVADADNDTVVVCFWNASDDSLYGRATRTDTAGGVSAGLGGLTWADNTTYEWYATADDNTTNVTSPTWNFTTASSGETPNSPPVANFTYTADGLAVDFTDTSTDSDGSVASYEWEFGDGQTATAVDPTHVYTTDGTYVVNLTVTDDDGATNTTSQSITVSSGGGGTVTTGSETLIYVVIIAVVAIAMVAMVMISRRRR